MGVAYSTKALHTTLLMVSGDSGTSVDAARIVDLIFLWCRRMRSWRRRTRPQFLKQYRQS